MNDPAQRARTGLATIALVVALVAAFVTSACGTRTALVDDEEGFVRVDGGPSDGAAGEEGGDPGPPECGNGRCGDDENCLNCSVDCGLCAGCGDGACSGEETCGSCPQDCGVCPTCGDGFCRAPETCLSCAPDCGKCSSCGDKVCDGRTEDCFSCPEDCGKCEGCGDGACRRSETCASCPQDCGVCAVCGNGKCEGPFETCSNCHQDCGDCQLVGCMGMLTCAFGCIDINARPPEASVSCVAGCVARGCADAQFFFDQAFNCILRNLSECGGNFNCYLDVCSAEVGVCIGSRCN